jgi:hypothetical protein
MLLICLVRIIEVLSFSGMAGVSGDDRDELVLNLQRRSLV